LKMADQALLEQLQLVLRQSILQNRGELLAPDVLNASRELDKMVLKIMRQGGEC
jgi:hypothetical protein